MSPASVEGAAKGLCLKLLKIGVEYLVPITDHQHFNGKDETVSHLPESVKYDLSDNYQHTTDVDERPQDK